MKRRIIRSMLVVVLRTWTGDIVWRPTAIASANLRQRDNEGIAPSFRAIRDLFADVRRCILKLAPHWRGQMLSHGPKGQGGWRKTAPRMWSKLDGPRHCRTR